MRKRDPHVPLTPAVFYILLALSGKERHGYDIMRQVQNDSVGVVTMGPGTLYGSLDRMMDAGLVERASHASSDARRIYYKLTAKGAQALQAEIERMSTIAKIASKRRLRSA